MEFFGRQEILSVLDKRAAGLKNGYRQNIAITGDALVGKTCLVKHWLSRYCDNYTLPLYIEVKPQEFGAFLEKFVGTLLFSFLKNSQEALKDDLGFLLDRSRSYIPRTCARIEELLAQTKKRRHREAFLKLLELAAIFYEETNKSCVIILDEFHLLEELNVKDIYGYLRKQIALDTRTMYILISSNRQRARDILTSDLNLLFGNFEKIELLPFDNASSQSLVRERLKLLNVPDELANFIISFCFCHPFYLNIVTNACVDYYARNGAAAFTVDSFASSLENIFLDAWGVLNRRFLEVMSEMEGSHKDRSIVKILLALGSGINNLSQLAYHTSKTKKEAAFLLNQLFISGVISKNADVYYVSDRIFSFWLRAVYNNQLRALSADSAQQRQIFRKEILWLFEAFREAQGKAFGVRILELFNKFSNESIEVHRKRLRLSHFKEVKLLDINGPRIREGVLARAANSLWVAGLKSERAEEEDIIEFAGICRKLKYSQPQKRIFITLDDIDENARLVAKEEKISTWDMPLVNSLFDIFDKPRIVK